MTNTRNKEDQGTSIATIPVFVCQFADVIRRFSWQVIECQRY